MTILQTIPNMAVPVVCRNLQVAISWKIDRTHRRSILHVSRVHMHRLHRLHWVHMHRLHHLPKNRRLRILCKDWHMPQTCIEIDEGLS